MILLDTCVVSELGRRRPNPQVREWFERTPETSLYLSVVTLGEISQGCARLPDGEPRQRIEAWLDGLCRDYEDRILDLDRHIAVGWGRLRGEAERRGAPLPVVDALLAATALRHGLTVATRNVSDFAATGVPLTNPWG